MKKLLLVPYSFLFILFFNSCSDNANTLPRYTGTAGEIVVVAENHIWESELGQAIQDHFYHVACTNQKYGFQIAHMAV